MALTWFRLCTVVAHIHGRPVSESSIVMPESAAVSTLYAAPFFILCRGLLTMRLLMFWSRKKSAVRKAAGTAQPNLAQSGTAAMPARRSVMKLQLKPLTALGMEPAMVSTPRRLTAGSEQSAVIATMTSAGPKSPTTLRSFLVPKGLCGIPVALRMSAKVSIVRFRDMMGAAALAPAAAAERQSVLLASYMKLSASSELKTSSVNCVQCLMSAGAPPAASRKSSADVHTPTQLYMAMNGSAKVWQNWCSATMNASVRPVGPMKVMGCPENTL
mmetsp:Transcript_3869/g.11189  ORF Transcript_3869/g.11189 Transcript_3869/m.11189 type:complete len:272 (-) Transcript_3869:862-1677(-)